jgi:ribonuclease HI
MNDAAFKSLIIFTDGACTGNPGPGGWASILAFPEGHVTELGGANPETTNNRMEMVGALRALASLEEAPSPLIILYTDSTYVIRGITQWIWAWKQRGWRNAEGGEVSNRDLWEELLRQVTRLKPAKIEWKYVRGHTGVPGNERCDEIAVAYSTGKKIKLYDGPLLGYGVAIHDLPEDQGLPEMRTHEKKPPAHSYISYVGGTVMRHKAWPECERRVKGHSGAKFKKAMSEQDEGEILRGWGLDPKTTVIKE